MHTSYEYDDVNRLKKITYPKQYGVAGEPRKEVVPTYDEASRLKDMTVDTHLQLGGVQYNAMGQVTSLTTGDPNGTTGPRDATELYGYDNATGLLTSQSVTRASDSTTLLNLSYGYDRGNSAGNQNGKTGQLTHITNLLNNDHNRDRSFEFDALGRLTAAKGGGDTGATGVTAHWTQSYSYDRYGNKTAVSATGITADSIAVPTDGIPTLAYDQTSNRITTSNYQYDNAGNLVKGPDANGVLRRYEYDAAGRLVKIRDDANPSNVIETYTYGADRNRLMNDAGSQKTYYAWGGSSVIQEYTEATGTTMPIYSKAYVYAGTRLLSTATNISGSELVEYHHPDRLGTKVVTTPSATPTSFEQSTLPFGTELAGEEIGIASTNQKFTSYDRSASTGLDYAVNRTYSPGQGRFAQVDPIGISATTASNPQSQNLYAYTQDNPIDFIDPSGLNLIAFFYPTNCRIIRHNEIGGPTYACDIGVHFMDTSGGNSSGTFDGGNGGAINRRPAPTKPAPPSKDQNELLKKCYKNALDGYNAAGNTSAQQWVESLKFSNFFSSMASLAIGGGSLLANIKPGISIPKVFIQNGKVMVKITPTLTRVVGLGVRAAGIGAVIGSIGVDVAEYAGLGREGFLRDAVRECNRAHPNATNKVTSLYNPFLSGKVSDVVNN